MSAFDATFRAAIPGSSLTHKMGSLPHEKPPQYTDPHEALEYFWKQLSRPDVMKQIWQISRNGGTVWAIARAVLYKAALEGIIQLNLALILYKTVFMMIDTIIQSRGLTPNRYPKFKNKDLDAAIKAKMQDVIKQYDVHGLVTQQPQTQQPPGGSPQDQQQAPQQPAQPQQQGQDQQPQGLMAMAQQGAQ